jgi:hypothetical protein
MCVSTHFCTFALDLLTYVKDNDTKDFITLACTVCQ